MTQLRPEQQPSDEAGSVAVILPVGEGLEKREPRTFLGTARRDLSEEELASPAARRFLIAEIERLDDECARHKALSLENADLRVDLATLRAGQTRSRTIDFLSFMSSTLGAAGLGAAPSYFAIVGGQTVGIVVLAASVLLIASGIIARVPK